MITPTPSSQVIDKFVQALEKLFTLFKQDDFFIRSTRHEKWVGAGVRRVSG
jgi:hypothetical protein